MNGKTPSTSVVNGSAADSELYVGGAEVTATERAAEENAGGSR